MTLRFFGENHKNLLTFTVSAVSLFCGCIINVFMIHSLHSHPFPGFREDHVDSFIFIFWHFAGCFLNWSAWCNYSLLFFDVVLTSGNSHLYSKEVYLWPQIYWSLIFLWSKAGRKSLPGSILTQSYSSFLKAGLSCSRKNSSIFAPVPQEM